MKNSLLLFISLMIFSLHSKAQTEFPIDGESKKITYSEVVQEEGSSKDDLFVRAKYWAGSSNLFKLIDANKEEGKVVVKGQFPVKYPAPMKGHFHDGFVNYRVMISVKDGKYKYTFTDIEHSSDRGNGGKLENTTPECGKYTLIPAGWGTIKNQAKEEMPKIVQAFKDAMDKPQAAPKNQDDW
jgi:hypothetical protein